MSIDWVNRAIDDLRAWGRAGGVEVDADEIRLLCDYASDYLKAEQLADFTPATFDELLLSIYPRKVIAPPESAPETVAAARTLVDFLCAEGHTGPETAAAMRVRLDDIAIRLPEALADESNFGMTKSLFSSIGPESLEQPISIPSGEQPQQHSECDCPGCSPLPAVRLAPLPELVAAAREVPLLAGEKPGRLDEHLDGVTDPLDRWAATVEFLLEHDTGGEITGNEQADAELYDLFDMLFRLQVPVPVALIAEYLEEIVEVGPVEVDRAVAGLVHAGLVALDAETVALTPLAVWGLRELYLERGMHSPEAPDLADADAMGLIEGLLQGIPTELAEEDIRRWLEGRTPAEAADELLGTASGAPAVARGIAITIVDRLGKEAEPAVRSCLGDPELRPHAIHWLNARGLPAPALTQQELLWVSVDMLALAMPAAEDDPEMFAENMAASGPPAHMIEEMWRVDHPDVVEVLELLGRSLPDGTVAKAARKAAFKARSRAIG
ncbi:hypothetical protein [Nonomuraea soli]|uniref:Uncharacterized protein n=1 Tax=Nonomuraea soli TaxID=1032476 RepID=A0A7W0CEI1_9ACTN|nr:hypothetical protein [Nonomuraea soli]MBA2889636.1 hypothetical protein [Nonomuraea soli]